MSRRRPDTAADGRPRPGTPRRPPRPGRARATSSSHSAWSSTERVSASGVSRPRGQVEHVVAPRRRIAHQLLVDQPRAVGRQRRALDVRAQRHERALARGRRAPDRCRRRSRAWRRSVSPSRAKVTPQKLKSIDLNGLAVPRDGEVLEVGEPSAPVAMSRIVVRVEKVPGVGVGVAGARTPSPPERPSGEIRARLGMPGSASSRQGVRSAPRKRTLTEAPSDPARREAEPAARREVDALAGGPAQHRAARRAPGSGSRRSARSGRRARDRGCGRRARRAPAPSRAGPGRPRRPASPPGPASALSATDTAATDDARRARAGRTRGARRSRRRRGLRHRPPPRGRGRASRRHEQRGDQDRTEADDRRSMPIVTQSAPNTTEATGAPGSWRCRAARARCAAAPAACRALPSAISTPSVAA